MYSMTVKFIFGRIELTKTITGANRDACMASVNYTLDANPALELIIVEEGSV
jgi:hypothetical protein